MCFCFYNYDYLARTYLLKQNIVSEQSAAKISYKKTSIMSTMSGQTNTTNGQKTTTSRQTSGQTSTTSRKMSTTSNHTSNTVTQLVLHRLLTSSS